MIAIIGSDKPKQFYVNILITILIVFNITSYQTQVLQAHNTELKNLHISRINPNQNDYLFHEGYEEIDNLESNGYYWDANDISNSLDVMISSDLPYEGLNSLKIVSEINNPPTILFIDLNIPVSEMVFISMMFYVEGTRSSTFRPVFIDALDNELSLDYGQAWSGWEPNPVAIYDVSYTFDNNVWVDFSRNITADIQTAISSSRSPYLEFFPSEILRIEIFQPFDGLTVNFMDELIIDDQSIGNEEILSSEIMNTSNYQDTTIFSELSFNLPWNYLFIILPLLAIIFGITIVLKQKSKFD